jgi:hypothetical protein
MAASSSLSSLSWSTGRAQSDPTPRSSSPRAAPLLRLIAQILDRNDADTIANVEDYLTFRLQCLAARDAPDDDLPPSKPPGD